MSWQGTAAGALADSLSLTHSLGLQPQSLPPQTALAQSPQSDKRLLV